jgi:hypothetical protein
MIQKLSIGLMLVTGVFLSGCGTTNPFTGEDQASKTAKGAGIGAAVGALVGIASSDSSRKRKERAETGGYRRGCWRRYRALYGRPGNQAPG